MDDRPQPTLETLLGYSIKRAQHTLRIALDRQLAEVGLTTPQYTALCFIQSVGPSSNADLARAGFVTPQTMHAVLTGLEASDFLERHPHPDSRKIILFDLTTAGARQLSEAHMLAAVIEMTMFAHLDRTEQRRLMKQLVTASEALDALR